MSQRFQFDSEKNELTTEINTVFRQASKILHWGFDSAGIGINEGIVDLILKNKSDLSVYVSEHSKWYRMKFANLQKFMRTYSTQFRVKTHTLFVFPLAWFDEEK